MRDGRVLNLLYVLDGELDDLDLDSPGPSTRADELWRRTCFEAFVRPEGGEAYHEFNFAPSTQWAAYRFDGYRAGMRAAEATPAVRVFREDGRFRLEARVALPHDGDWRVALTAVIEDAAGGLSYWSLAHPSAKPDFHHAGGFALELPASERP